MFYLMVYFKVKGYVWCFSFNLETLVVCKFK